MTYAPSEDEKQFTAIVQALAAVFLFIPPLVGLQIKEHRRSPYNQYWSRVCLMWSLIMTILMVTGGIASYILKIPGPLIVLAAIHVVFCITGAMSSYFNSPFKYWFVAKRLCAEELGNVYGQLTSSPTREHEER